MPTATDPLVEAYVVEEEGDTSCCCSDSTNDYTTTPGHLPNPASSFYTLDAYDFFATVVVEICLLRTCSIGNYLQVICNFFHPSLGLMKTSRELAP